MKLISYIIYHHDNNDNHVNKGVIVSISNCASIIIISYMLPYHKYDTFDNIFNIYMICIFNIITL